MHKFVVTITPPTPNGDLHIGHLAGPFLGADVFTRAQRQRGHHCVLVSYSDDYQSYMLRRGLELGVDHKVLAAENTGLIKRSLNAVDIEIDWWMTSQDNSHFRAAVEDCFMSAKRAGALTWKTSQEPYCPHCDVWGYEAYGRGLCNFCGHDSDASQCEECAQAPDASQMEQFHCKLCGRDHQWLPVERWFLRLGEFQGYLSALHTAHPMRPPLGIWAERAIPTLQDWGVTRPGDGGLDLMPDGSCRIHTWFMGLAGYIAALREYAAMAGDQALANDFLRDPKAKFVHFLGYDCAFSHALVYPVLLSTMTDYKIEQRFVPNLFLKLDGENLSTSRRHAIWVAEFAERAPSDSIRLYLASVAPEQEGGDFLSKEFDQWLVDTFEVLIPKIIKAGSRAQDTDLTTQAVAEDPDIRDLKERLERATDPENFSMKAMASVVLDALDLTRRRMDTDQPISPIALFLAAAGEPLVPRLSAQIAKAYGFDEAALIHAIRG